MMSGAALDTPAVQLIVKAIAPAVMQAIPFDVLDDVYARWLLPAMSDPGRPSVMVTAHNLLSTWATMLVEQAALLAADTERMLVEYRATVQAELSANPRPIYSMADLARRDGVALPFAPGEPEKAQERVARAESNREVYLRMIAEHELSLVNKKKEEQK